jgi:hypothetical protein
MMVMTMIITIHRVYVIVSIRLEKSSPILRRSLCRKIIYINLVVQSVCNLHHTSSYSFDIFVHLKITRNKLSFFCLSDKFDCFFFV